MVKIGLISDTHNKHGSLQVPDLDILIHAGDFCGKGSYNETSDFTNWLLSLKQVKHKVYIAGNHDKWVQKNSPISLHSFDSSIHYLQDRYVEVEGLKIYGTPWTPYFYDWAFQGLETIPNYGYGYKGGPGRDAKPERDYPLLSEVYGKIPEDTDILVCHGPPRLDPIDNLEWHEKVGSYELLARLDKLPNLKVGVFGHLHSGYGEVKHNNAMLYNVSTLDENYSNPKPIKVIEIENN